MGGLMMGVEMGARGTIGGVGDWMMGGMSKETGGVVLGGSISHGCSNASGNVVGGV